MKIFTPEIFNLPFSLQIVHYGPRGSYGRITETSDLLSHTVHEGVFLNSRHLRKKLGALFIHLHFDKLITTHMKDLIFFLMLAWEHLLHDIMYCMHSFTMTFGEWLLYCWSKVQLLLFRKKIPINNKPQSKIQTNGLQHTSSSFTSKTMVAVHCASLLFRSPD